MKNFDDAWKTWIWQNVGGGSSKDVIFKILLENGFEHAQIRDELDYEPSVPLDQIENPYAEDQQPCLASEDATSDGSRHLHADPIAPLLWQIDEVLTQDECEALIETARPRLERSTVIVNQSVRGHESSEVSDLRTGSSTIFFEDHADTPVLKNIAAKLREIVGALSELPIENQEPFQILHYSVSEEYHSHHDAFSPGSEHLEWERERGGQRLFSFMVYLNDVARGGQTEFPQHSLKVVPKLGRAVFWGNILGGDIYNGSWHAALPVTEGEKWVLVCWVREASASEAVGSISEQDDPADRNATRDSPRDAARDWLDPAPSLEVPNWIKEQTREQQEAIPLLGAGGSECRGFEIRKLEPTLHAELKERYHALRSRLVPETGFAIGNFLDTVSRDLPPALFFADSELNERVSRELQPLHEQWCGFELEPSACYGFRVYLPGAYLHLHVDRPETHVISSSLCIDSGLYAPWPLQIFDADDKEHQLELHPGEILLYESARLAHGRPVPLNGRFYVGLFVHYQPAEDAETWRRSPQDWRRRHLGQQEQR